MHVYIGLKYLFIDEEKTFYSILAFNKIIKY